MSYELSPLTASVLFVCCELLLGYTDSLVQKVLRHGVILLIR